MALSNIFREPRREIVESAVGLAILGAFVWCDYQFALWLQETTVGTMSSKDTGAPWPLGMLLGCFGFILCVLALFATHALGDAVCNALQRNGIHLRPRLRK